MADDPNVTPPTPPLANDPTARTPEGTIKDQQIPPTPDPKSPPTDPSNTPTDPPAKPGDKPTAPTAPQVPEKYEFTAPDGFELDPKVLEEATPVFKELGLTQEQATKLFDIYAKHSAEGTDKLVEQYEAVRDGWRKEIVSDKAIGDGKTGLAPEAKQNIAAAIEALPTDLRAPFKEAMDATGAGDHPAFVRAWNWLGQQFREGSAVSGTKPSPLGQKPPGAGPRSAASALYPNLPSSGA